MTLYVLLGLLGLAVTLVGTTTDLNRLIPVGIAVILGAFVWFARNRQGTPIVTEEDGARR